MKTFAIPLRLTPSAGNDTVPYDCFRQDHDMQKDPLLRKAPYGSTETQRVIADVFYIDTRTLLEIAKDVIDGKLSQAEAQLILFGKLGRVVYSRKEESTTSESEAQEATG